MSQTTTRDMTKGSILSQLIMFSLPLLLGNAFQLLYNMVDTIVVGNFVGKEALAAVGSTTMIINMVVFFFNGFSVGASVAIARSFGAKDFDRLHKSIETTMAMTLGFGVFFTAFGILAVRPMLRLMATPDDVMDEATIYLRTYMAGISGLMIYNMASGILRAVGDTKRPLYFLIFCSVLNMVLDIAFVVLFKWGVFGVAFATIVAQFISAALVIRLITKTNDVYKLTWSDLGIDKGILSQIIQVGLPAAIQSTITSLSNTFVQSYVNFFGSSVMAGWSCYNKLDQFLFLPINSMSNAATTFVSQNMGARDIKRADKGTTVAVSVSLTVTFVITLILFIFAEPANSIFTKDAEVIQYGSMFIRANVWFLLANCVGHTLGGAIRGRGDSKGPMFIVLFSFVLVRQLYLYLVTHFYANTPLTVSRGYPVGWVLCGALMLLYYLLVVKKRKHSI
ncbi:MAG: MATE family efflux transporter [Firmicutes bacterium]|nr:MATE family efflux transporter [Bacillota bacterium]